MQVSKSARLSVLVLCLGLAVSAVSHAALFDDTEARKRIIEVETKAAADHDAQQNAINELTKAQKVLEKRIQSLETLVNGHGLLEMQNQVEQLKQDMAQLKGDLEVATHNLDTLQRKQNESYLDLDTRLRRLESVPVSTPADGNPKQPEVKSAEAAKQAEAAQQESKAFADAEAFSQAGKYKEAFEAYDTFLKNYSGSKLVPDALYGMGFAQYGLKNYKSSMATQQKFMENYAAHVMAPNAMMNLANSQIQLGQIPAAKKTLKELIAAYPASDMVPMAQKRLKVLETIK